MHGNAYVIVLIAGALLVAIDGQLIYTAARRYAEGEGSTGSATSAMPIIRMVVAAFHLVGLGVLALWATVDIGGWNSLSGVVPRLGVLMLLLAIAHAVATSVVSGIGEEHTARARLRGSPVTPVPGQPGAHTTVSPAIEQEKRDPSSSVGG